MKKYLFVVILLLSRGTCIGQVAKWLIPPVYDTIGMAKGVDLVISQSADEKSIWDLSGQLLAKTKDVISPFVEGRSVTTDSSGRNVTGFF